MSSSAATAPSSRSGATAHQRRWGRRSRKQTQHYHSATTQNGFVQSERQWMQTALQNSTLDQTQSGNHVAVPAAPVFFLTIKDLEGNPLDYISKIRAVAEPYGICKLVPPWAVSNDDEDDDDHQTRRWNPPFVTSPPENGNRKKLRFSTKQQWLHRLQEGIAFGDGDEYTAQEYQDYALAATRAYQGQHYPHHDLLTRAAAADAAATEPSTGRVVSSDPANDDNDDKEAAPTLSIADHVKLAAPDLLSPPVAENENHRQRLLWTTENLERDYWDLVEQQQQQPQRARQQHEQERLAVEYGNDVDTHVFGSGFPLSERGRTVGQVDQRHNKNDDDEEDEEGDKLQKEDMSLPEPEFGTDEYYKETWWNLNNLPRAPGSVLRHVCTAIKGINVPWMYYGSLFTTFCWHNEDNYLASINYHHRGAPKQWYGVPGTEAAAAGLERVFSNYLSMKMRDVPDLLHHITTMFSPRLLQNAGTPVYKLCQYEGEYVVTFPRAFHGGFSYGPNVGEAVNFATNDWISFGADANERYRSFARPAVFSHDRLTFTMANHVEEQNRYETCRLLLVEVERVVEEELRLRQQLSQKGVRNVSNLISLPPNKLDQLDDASARYDDKRLCHACKHVCFFSAVACECSQSKVSCLRHSHYMCRCPNDRKYFMIWSPDEELESTCDRVRRHCNLLKEIEGGKISVKDEPGSGDDDVPPTSVENDSSNNNTSADDSSLQLPDIVKVLAPGVGRDAALHKDWDISPVPILSDSYRSARQRAADAKAAVRAAALRKDVVINAGQQRKRPLEAVVKVGDDDDDDEDDEIQIVAVTGPSV